MILILLSCPNSLLLPTENHDPDNMSFSHGLSRSGAAACWDLFIPSTSRQPSPILVVYSDTFETNKQSTHSHLWMKQHIVLSTNSAREKINTKLSVFEWAKPHHAHQWLCKWRGTKGRHSKWMTLKVIWKGELSRRVWHRCSQEPGRYHCWVIVSVELSWVYIKSLLLPWCVISDCYCSGRRSLHL